MKFPSSNINKLTYYFYIIDCKALNVWHFPVSHWTDTFSPQLHVYIPSISNFAFIKVKGISSYIAYFNDVLNNPSKFKVHIFQWTLVLIHRTTSIVDIVYRENTSRCPSKIIIITIIIFITIIGNLLKFKLFH